MAYHDWSEDNFDWKSLNEGIDYIHEYMVKYGRIGVHSKEKYGTARITAYFWSGSLHGLTHPGYAYSQYPKWLWTFDIYYITPFCRKIGLVWLVEKWQSRVYRKAYANAVRMYPHIKDELTCCADQKHLLKGIV
jgi:hypothetical protein